MFQSIYFEEYELNHSRKTLGRTITEADIVLHAGRQTKKTISEPNLPTVKRDVIDVIRPRL